MTFTPGMPFDGETLGQSKPEVRNNFTSLRQAISNTVKPNHNDVLPPSGVPGTHLFVEMPVQVAGAANLPAANEGGLITQTVSGKSELFYVRDNVAVYTQLTNGDTTIGASGSTYLPGGLILKYGSGPRVGVNTPVLFAGGAFPTACLSVTCSVEVGASITLSISPGTIATTGFTLRCSPAGVQPYYYIAIGN